MTRVTFHNRRVWLTGASYGIGRACALEFARRGARVAISARSQDLLEEVAREAAAGSIEVVPLDVTDRAAHVKAVKRVVEKLGGIDTLFLNAGTCEYVDPDAFDAGVFERLMSVNFLSMTYAIEASLEVLARGASPHLVGMGTTVAWAPLPRAEAYGATKAAIAYLMGALRISLKHRNIDVSLVSPGFVQTPLTDKNDFPMPLRISSEEAARAIADGIECRRREVHFPKAFSWPAWWLSKLPAAVRERVAMRFRAPRKS